MAEVTSESNSPRGVFLSYSSHDRDAALRLKDGLELAGVAVRIDVRAMQPGESIQDFILESIRTTVATVLVVSERSLLSSWVAVEVSSSLEDMELWKERKFIACYLDQSFFDPGFRLRATDWIDAELEQINRLIPDYNARKLDTSDLNSEKTRLFKLRNGLGDFLRHLKESLCLDIRGDQLAKGVSALTAALCPHPSSQSRTSLSNTSDIERRKDEVYDLVANGDGDRALKRIMDFLRDFSTDSAAKRSIVVTMGNYRRLEAERSRSLQEVRLERTDILYQALDLLDGTIEQLSRRVA